MGNTASTGTQPVRRARKFLKDIGIYAIGQLGSKLVMFLLVPLYTHFVEPADYGYYDLSFSVILLLEPLFLLQLSDGSFRFLLDADSEAQRRSIVRFVTRRLAFNVLLTLLCAVALSFIVDIALLGYITACLIVHCLYDVSLQVIRGLDRNRVFVEMGILCSLLTGLLSVATVVWFGWGVKGIFVANIAAKAICLVVMEVRIGLVRNYLRGAKPEPGLGAKILRYSLPILVCNMAGWALININKFIVEHYLGLAETGLFGVAVKFASIVQVVANILYLAWQENAIKNYNSPDRDSFFSQVLNSYFYLLSGFVVAFSFSVRLCYPWLVGPDYQTSAAYLYMLTASAMLYSFGTFFDLGYMCSKRTLAMLPSILAAITINIVGSLIGVSYWGAYGIIFATLLSNVVLVVWRIFETRRYFVFRIDARFPVYVSLLAAGAVLYSMIETPAVDALMLVATVAAFVFTMPAHISSSIRAKFRLQKD